MGAVEFLPTCFGAQPGKFRPLNLNRSTISRLLGTGTLRQYSSPPGPFFSSWSVLVSWSRLWVGSSKRVDNTTTGIIWAASRPVGHHNLEQVGFFHFAVFVNPVMTTGELGETRHIVNAHLGNGGAEKVGTLQLGGSHQQTTVAAATDAQIFRAGNAGLDQGFAGGDKVVEYIVSCPQISLDERTSGPPFIKPPGQVWTAGGGDHQSLGDPAHRAPGPGRDGQLPAGF